MRKIAPFLILLIFFTFVILVISKFSGMEHKIEYVSTLENTDQEIIKVCVLNDDQQLVLINTNKHTNENIYIYVLKLFDHYRNNLPASYKTPLKGNFEIEKVSKDKDILYIDLKMQYFEAGLNEFLSGLVWSYHDLGINKLYLDINGNKFSLERNHNINSVIVGEDIYNNEKQIIYYENGNEIIPVTYFHKQDKLSFLLNKIASKYQEIKYDFEIVDKFLVVRIEDPNNSLSEAAIRLIIRSIEQIGEFDEIVIIINDIDVYNL